MKLVRIPHRFAAFDLTALQVTELPLSTFSLLSTVQSPLNIYCITVKPTLNFPATLSWA